MTLSIDELRSVDLNNVDLVSMDLFDTLLLRDYGTQRGRFQDISQRVSTQLATRGVTIDASRLFKLRCLVHHLAYTAVMIERPDGDATLAHMIDIQLAVLGLNPSFAGLFQDAELAVEVTRLLPNDKLLRLLQSFRSAGKRIIVVSDMYYSRANLDFLIRNVLKDHPIDHVYVSSDVGLTKASGQLLPRIAELEGVSLRRILHCGDNHHGDLVMARAAGCQAVLLPRPAWVLWARRLSALLFAIKHPGAVTA